FYAVLPFLWANPYSLAAAKIHVRAIKNLFVSYKRSALPKILARLSRQTTIWGSDLSECLLFPIWEVVAVVVLEADTLGEELLHHAFLVGLQQGLLLPQ